jgi:hypothetical protein
MFIFLCFNRGFTYYKMSNLDNRISNVDQLLTTDVDKFCDTVTDLYSNISKPLLDMVIYVYRITTQIGGKVNDRYVGCPKSKCTGFLFKCLLGSPEITSCLLQSMTHWKLHIGSNIFTTDHSSTGSHFP